MNNMVTVQVCFFYFIAFLLYIFTAAHIALLGCIPVYFLWRIFFGETEGFWLLFVSWGFLLVSLCICGQIAEHAQEVFVRLKDKCIDDKGDSE